jgi:glucose-1-phosphate thymidylyltransferase
MKECTTAVVLAARLGSRMRREASASPLSAAQAAAAARGLKGMIPDGRGRPFLDHVLSSLADGGVTDVCLIVGPDHDSIREHYALRPPRRVTLAFATQQSPIGTADALLAATPWFADGEVLVLNADNLYPVAAIDALVNLGEPGCIAFERAALIQESNIDPARIAAYAILTLRPDDTLAGIVEKPGAEHQDVDDGTWISMNFWRFNAEILAACRDVSPSPRGELELPLAVALAISRGVRLRAVRMCAGVVDLSNRDDILEMARRLGDRDIQP